jgi:DNA-binding XRE family transcriptional regulator
MTIETITRDGRRFVVLPEQEYQDLIDARDAEAAMRAVASGAMSAIPAEAMDAYLNAPTPLAFWRRHRGLTQADLAEAADVSQAYIAQIEGGTRRAVDIGIMVRLARRQDVRVDDLVDG